MLNLDWYIQHPIDFEYKNYILLDYLQSVDKSFQLHKLSPYLLWTEKLVSELKDFHYKREQFLKNLERDVFLYEQGKVHLNKVKISEPKFINIINDIIEYSTPMLESKIKFGYKLLDKYPQLLY